MGQKMVNMDGRGDEDESNSGGEDDLFGRSKCDSADDNGKEGGDSADDNGKEGAV